MSLEPKYFIAFAYFIISRPSLASHNPITHFVPTRLHGSHPSRSVTARFPSPDRSAAVLLAASHPIESICCLLSSSSQVEHPGPVQLYSPTRPRPCPCPHITATSLQVLYRSLLLPAAAVFPLPRDPLITDFPALPDPALSTHRFGQPTRRAETR
jgi:hypothetical protein